MGSLVSRKGPVDGKIYSARKRLIKNLMVSNTNPLLEMLFMNFCEILIRGD